MTTHHSAGILEKRGGVAAKITVAILAALLLVSSLILALASPARAQEADSKGLTRSGPIDPSNGYPYWYEDENGLKLDLCLDPQDDMCLQPFEMPDPDAPVSFPDNFPGEAFWWIGEAETTTNTNGGNALLSMALESAWGGDESVRDGSQISFGRIRIRVDDLAIGSTYRVTHPYGVEEFIAEDDGNGAGEINFTEDLGCLTGALTKCDFDEALAGDVGPFLTWDTFGEGNDDSDLRGPDGEPNAYVGDPNTPHTVTGSPNGTNYFKVEEQDAVGNWVTIAETDEFTISGKVAEPQVKPEAVGAERSATVFNDANQKIKLISSDPEAQVYYTTDGTPVVDPDTGEIIGTPYIHSDNPNEGIILNSDPNALTGTKTQLNYVAVKDGQNYEGSKTFEVDLLAPNLTVSELAGTYDEASKDIEFTTNERAQVYYTTDGSNPRYPDNPARKSFVYDPNAPTPEADPETGTVPVPENVVHIGRSQTIRAIAVDLDPANNDAEVNWGQPRSYEYILAALKAAGPVNPLGGFPYWYEDQNGLRLDMCLDPNDQKCLQPFESPDPTAPVSFPDNFPGEAFWWTGEADLNLPGSKKSMLSMAHEAAWGGADEAVRDGDQIVFGRIRVRIDGLQIGQQYRVSHPYGTDTYVAEDDGSGGGEINVTEDIGCGELGPVARCDFNEARFGRVGPFLTWNTFGDGTDENLMALDENGQPDPSRPDAYVGDPNVEHAIKGSPVLDGQGNPQNYFKLERNNGGNWETVSQTDQFAISGKVSGGTQVGASKTTGFYNEPIQVVLGASDENAQILFTLDGSDPRTNGQPYNGPISIDAMNEVTTLKYVTVIPATDANEAVYSDVYEQVYTLDNIAPTVNTSVEPGVFNEPQQVTLTTGDGAVTAAPASARTLSALDDSSGDSSSDGGGGRVTAPAADSNSKIYYTTDGSEPTTSSTVYTNPIKVDKTQTIKALAVDAAGNRSEVASFKYIIEATPADTTAPNVTASVSGGSFNKAQKVALRTNDPAATIHYTTNGSTPTTASAKYGAPITINKITTLKFFSVDPAGNRSGIVTQKYTIRTASRTSLNVTANKLKQGKKGVIRGVVRPVQPSGKVKLVIRKPGKDVVRNLRLTNSRYKFAYKPPVAGRYKVQVSFAQDADNMASKSMVKKFRVIRR